MEEDSTQNLENESGTSELSSALRLGHARDDHVNQPGSADSNYQGSFDNGRNATLTALNHENQQNSHYGNFEQHLQYTGPGFQSLKNTPDPPLLGHAYLEGNGTQSAAGYGSAEGYVSSQAAPTRAGAPSSTGDHTNDAYNNTSMQSQNSQSLAMLGIGRNCTYCTTALHPSIESPVILCPGCGPMCNIRYCSTACLLVDALNHSAHCMHMPASQRLIQHNLSDDYIYERKPIAALDGFTDPPERLRQKAFSMYCYSGQFPKLYKTWAKKHQEVQVPPGFDENESIKKTGDYAVFRSEVTGGASRNNPNTDVIFT